VGLAGDDDIFIWKDGDDSEESRTLDPTQSPSLSPVTTLPSDRRRGGQRERVRQNSNEGFEGDDVIFIWKDGDDLEERDRQLGAWSSGRNHWEYWGHNGGMDDQNAGGRGWKNNSKSSKTKSGKSGKSKSGKMCWYPGKQNPGNGWKNSLVMPHRRERNLV